MSLSPCTCGMAVAVGGHIRQICRRLLAQTTSMEITSGLQRDWDLSVNAVELDSGPVYFCGERVLSDSTTRDAVTVHKETLIKTFTKAFPSSVSFAFTACNPGDVSQSDVKNAIDLDKLEKELVVLKQSGTSFQLRRSYGFFPDDSSHFERGVFLTISTESDFVKQARKFVNDMCIKYGQVGYFEYNCRDGCVYQDLVAVPSQKVEAVSPLIRVTNPYCHPVFAHPNTHSIFHSITKLQRVLSEMKVSV